MAEAGRGESGEELWRGWFGVGDDGGGGEYGGERWGE